MTTTSSISTQLGAGSGIDIPSLITALVDAQSKGKTDAITKKSDTLTSQISAASTLKSGLSSFSTALASLVNGGSLSSAAVSSDPSIATVKALPGAHLDNKVSTTLKVRTLATAQVANSVAYVPAKTSVVGKGTMTFTLGTATVASNQVTGFTAGAATPITITIDDSNSTLQGIADTINAAGAGVTASIVTDSGGARLALKSATGAASAFTVDVAEDGAPGLAAFEVGVGKTGTSIAQSAVDAEVDVDGVSVKRASNTISDLITGMQIDLQSVNAGKTITLGATAPTDSLKGAVNDFVATFNELKTQLNTQTNAQTGSLYGDTGAQAMVRALSTLVTTSLLPASAAGGPRTLAELGVGTNRDGTLTVNASQLAAALTKYPAQVEKIFSGGAGASDNGLSAALKSISDTVTSTTTGLGASEQRYTKLKSSLSDQQTKVTDAADQMRTRLTKQFASMDARVNAYKSTQTFLKNQVAAWNSNN